MHSGGKMKVFFSIFITASFCLFCFGDAECAMRMKMRTPKQSYSRQIGGNANQKSKIEYDRGGKRIIKEVKPGQTHFIPKDAKNVNINGMRIRQGERVTTSPRGASLFDD